MRCCGTARIHAWLQARIASRVGHLSNRDAGAFARATVHARREHVVLAHLSENNNRPSVALASMTAALARTRFRGHAHRGEAGRGVGPVHCRRDRARCSSSGRKRQYAVPRLSANGRMGRAAAFRDGPSLLRLHPRHA